MCEACKAREMLDVEDHQASALLHMLIRKAHAEPLESGGARVEIGLADSELDWLAAWGAANEDAEDDDPAEESEAAEESEQLEADCRERFGPNEGVPAAHLMRISRGK